MKAEACSSPGLMGIWRCKHELAPIQLTALTSES